MSDFIRPYKQAYDAQVKRTALVPKDYFKLAEGLRPQAITVSGLERYASVVEVDRLMERALGENKTMSEALDELGKIIDDHGGLVLSPQRLELIHWNAIKTVESSAQYREMMEQVEDRPVFMYYGPDNGPNHTISPICAPLHKKKARYDNPILRHFWGPNHHHEYHEWVSLTEKEAGTEGFLPADAEYPLIEGVELRPAAGFDFDPAKGMVDESAFAEGVASLKGVAQRKASTDYDLSPLAELAQSELEAAPKIARAIGTTSAATEKAWAAWRSALGIDAGDGAWAIDAAGDGVRINKASFEELLAADRENGRYLQFVAPAIRQPTETWWVPYETDEGTAYAKRYLKVFQSGKRRIGLIVDTTPPGIAAGDGRTPGAWLWRMKVVDGSGDGIEDFRKGLLAHTKGKRKTQ